jgi:hypothetical protein
VENTSKDTILEEIAETSQQNLQPKPYRGGGKCLFIFLVYHNKEWK